jgi:dTDP-4-amino-4,6-dideoxygalactose transaminase
VVNLLQKKMIPINLPQVDEQEVEAVVQVLRSGLLTHRFGNGPMVRRFEEAFAKFAGVKHAVAVNSGTAGLHMALLAAELASGDEVIVPSFTFVATAESVVLAGARPVFVDIDPETYNIDAEKVEEAVTEKTKAIMPVHLFGQMADIDPIMEVAHKYNLAVIEDAAQSITSTYKGRKAGSIGTVGCFSFFPSKNLGAAGDGGMVVTNDEQLYDRLKLMRNHGANPKYYHKFVGANFRLDPIQAAVLLVKLPHLSDWSEARRRNAEFYNRKFTGTNVETPYINQDCVSIYNQYVIRVPKRDQLIAHLKDKNIGCEIYYPRPMHLQECFKYLGYKEGDFPEVERAAKEVLAIPIYPELTDEMKDYVAETILSFPN